MKPYPSLPDDLLSEMLSSDKGIQQAANPVTCCDRGGRPVCKRVSWPSYLHPYSISENQLQAAVEARGKRRAEILAEAAVPGTLLFVKMGSDFESGVEGGIGNHRFRTYARDASGHVIFVELQPILDRKTGNPDVRKGFWAGIGDETFNQAEDERYDRELDEVRERYGERVPMYAWPKHPGQKYRHEEVTGNPCTFDGVLAWARITLGCDYTRVLLTEPIVTAEEFVCNPVPIE